MTTVAQQFTAKWRPIIEPIATKYGLNPDFVLTQIAQESGWGQHTPTGSNNYAGITDPRRKSDGIVASDNGNSRKFRKFANDQAFAEYYVDMLSRLYPGTTKAKTIEEFSAALQDGKRKYAESPTYKDALKTVYNDHYATGSANGYTPSTQSAGVGLADYALARAQVGQPVTVPTLPAEGYKDPYADIWGVNPGASSGATLVNPSRGTAQKGGGFEYLWGIKK